MESYHTGKEQLMFRAGQISEDINVFWSEEFRGYHGLRSVADIPWIGIKVVWHKRLTQCEFEHCHSLVRQVCPFVRDPICYYLISMIMLLDTSSLVDNSLKHLEENDSSKSLGEPHGINNPSVNELYGASLRHACTSPIAGYNDNISLEEKQCEEYYPKSPSMNERFQEIKILQKHYISLLRNRCMHLNSPKLRRFGDTDVGLRRTMFCLRQIAQYIPMCK